MQLDAKDATEAAHTSLLMEPSCSYEVVTPLVAGQPSAESVSDALMQHGYYAGAKLLVVPASPHPEISTLNGVPGKCLAAYRQPLAVVQQQRSPALGPAMAVVQTANEALVVASWILDHMAASVRELLVAHVKTRDDDVSQLVEW